MPDTTSTFSPPMPRHVKAATLIGATSPLWSYFAGAALFGTAWWWMSRWAAPAAPKTLPAVAKTPMSEPPPAPVGGEAAPISAVALAPEPARLIEAPPIPAVEAAAGPPPPKPRKAKDSESKPH